MESSVVYGLHNQKIELKLEGHITNGCLNAEETKFDNE